MATLLPDIFPDDYHPISVHQKGLSTKFGSILIAASIANLIAPNPFNVTDGRVLPNDNLTGNDNPGLLYQSYKLKQIISIFEYISKKFSVNLAFIGRYVDITQSELLFVNTVVTLAFFGNLPVFIKFLA